MRAKVLGVFTVRLLAIAGGVAPAGADTVTGQIPGFAVGGMACPGGLGSSPAGDGVDRRPRPKRSGSDLGRHPGPGSSRAGPR
jgi:hypothetical protein